MMGPLFSRLSAWRFMPGRRAGRAFIALLVLSAGVAGTSGSSAVGSRSPGVAVPFRALTAIPAIAAEELPEQPSPDDRQALVARAINAAVPFAPGRLAPAQPFYLNTDFENLQRATDCLAAADYYEAGRDPAGQRAVAQVVLNRLRNPIFPRSICGVVFEGSERRTGCQFTFTCDGALDRRTPTPQAWAEARQLAGEMLLGRVDPTVGQSTHYHTDWVTPPWDREMDKVAAVGTHLFYRWRGVIGQAGAFVQRYSGAEPSIARLARLSSFHAAGGPIATAAPAVPAEPVATLVKSSLPIVRMQSGAPEPGVFLVALPAGADPDSFQTMAEQKCAGFGDCRFIGWTDPKYRARELPLPGASVDAISFTFVRSMGAAGRARWNCTEFARQDPGQCLGRGA